MPLRRDPFFGLDKSHTLSLSWTSLPSCWSYFLPIVSSRPFLFAGTSWTAGSVKVHLIPSSPSLTIPSEEATICSIILPGRNFHVKYLFLVFWELFGRCKWADHWIGWGISNQQVSGWNKWQDGEYFDQKKNKAFGCRWKIAPSRLGSLDYRAEIYFRKRFTPLVIRDFTFSAKSRKVWD